MDNKIPLYLKKFTHYVDLFLAGALAAVSIFAIGLFLYDVFQLFFGQKGIEEGILKVLGSLLILWASIAIDS